MKELTRQLQLEGISDQRVLAAIDKVPREKFVSAELQNLAYADEALPIECGQTISQPFVVCLMTQLILRDGPVKKVLEIGTGSGYQAAVLAEIVPAVYSIERIKELYQQASARLAELNYDNVHVHYGDGFAGWAEHAPYDAIIVTAASPEIPKALTDQLTDGGRLLLPVGSQFGGQQLCLVSRRGDELHRELLDPVVFVPMLHGTADS